MTVAGVSRSSGPRREPSSAEREKDLAKGVGVERHPAAQPIGGTDEVGGVDLRQVLDAERGRHTEIHSLATDLGEALERRLAQLDQITVGDSAMGEPHQHRPGPERAARAGALHQRLALEG